MGQCLRGCRGSVPNVPLHALPTAHDVCGRTLGLAFGALRQACYGTNIAPELMEQSVYHQMRSNYFQRSSEPLANPSVRNFSFGGALDGPRTVPSLSIRQGRVLGTHNRCQPRPDRRVLGRWERTRRSGSDRHRLGVSEPSITWMSRQSYEFRNAPMGTLRQVQFTLW